MPTDQTASDPVRDAFDAFVAGDYATAADGFETVAMGLSPGDDRSRGLRLASTAARLGGDADRAVELSADAAAIAETPSFITEAHLEVATVALVRGALDEARRALRHARAVDTGDDKALTAKLVAHQAYVAAAAGDHTSAADALDELGRLLSDEVVPPRDGTLPAQAASIVDMVVNGPRDGQPAAIQRLLDAAGALRAGDLDTAQAHLDTARRAAREAEDVPSYVGTALLEARVAELRDDRDAAYRSIAVGWASVRAAFGDEMAVTAFEPAMVELRDRWGPETFDEIRSRVATES